MTIIANIAGANEGPSRSLLRPVLDGVVQVADHAMGASDQLAEDHVQMAIGSTLTSL